MANSMILEIPVKPEKRDELVEIMKGALPDTAAYDGCQRVDMWTPEDDGGKLLVFEIWDSKDHQAKYFNWRVESGMMEQIGDFLAGEPKVTWLKDHEF